MLRSYFEHINPIGNECVASTCGLTSIGSVCARAVCAVGGRWNIGRFLLHWMKVKPVRMRYALQELSDSEVNKTSRMLSLRTSEHFLCVCFYAQRHNRESNILLIAMLYVSGYILTTIPESKAFVGIAHCRRVFCARSFNVIQVVIINCFMEKR